jgi:glycosyltransferase involved in cell wall biosynthesis
MTSLIEPTSSGVGERALGAAWRAEMLSAQEDALPEGRVVVSCGPRPGAGGLGRHLQEIVAALDRRAAPRMLLCASAPDVPADAPRRLGTRAADAALSLPPLRLEQARRMLQSSVRFDADAAARLPDADHLIAFNGIALEQMRRARGKGFQSLSLASATAHFAHVLRQHARAFRQYPLEGSWAKLLRSRNTREYAEADRIYVASGYVRDSFLAEGAPADSLVSFPLTPDPRFTAAAAPPAAGSFDILYIGSLTVVKGVPLLIDAVRSLPHRDLRLRLGGGWTTRGMRRFVQRACAADPRISVVRSDPLPLMRAARLFVHASYSDGFGYAPAEALACGVPVIASEDTGMKDLLAGAEGHGLVVPTGDRQALAEAIDAAYRGELPSAPRGA